MKKTRLLAVLMAAAMLLSAAALSSCSNQASDKAEETTVSAENDGFLAEDDSADSSAEESELYKKAVKVVSDKDVDEYTCCKLAGSANYYIVTRNDDDYKFYKVALNGPEYEGELDADDTTAYIDLTTATLGLFKEDDGKWKFGLVNAGDKITCDYDQKGSTDKVPKFGGKAKFSKPDDTEALKIFS